MNLLVLLSVLGLAQCIDLSGVQDIEQLMLFIKGAGNRLPEAADELDGIKIEGKSKYAEVLDEYLLGVNLTDQDRADFQILRDLVDKIDQAWNDLGTKDPGDDDKTQLAAAATTRDELFDYYVKNDTNKGIPYQMAAARYPVLCEITMPEQLRVKKVHQAVTLSELRAFILGLKNGDDSQKAVAKAILNSEEIILSSKVGMEKTEDDYRACDPPEHIRGKTFGEFLGLFQGVVVNDGHTNNRDGTGECGTSCDELDDAIIDRCYKRREGYGWTSHCHNKKCNGRLFECIHVNGVQACELEAKSDRRFSWTYSPAKGRTFGKDDGCDGKKVNILESGFIGANTCLTCLCVCAEEDDTSKAIRTVSLLPQFANIKDNMIVTGLRFQEKDKMFHIQIEESKLGPLGEIVSGTSKWKKLDSVTYDPKTGTFQTRKGVRKIQLYENLDYKIFNRDSRGVNLDKVRTPFGEVIVGVSLRYNEDDDAVEIQILSWPFDYSSGALIDPIDLEDESISPDWITWQNSPRRSGNYKNPRFEISLSLLDIPTLASTNRVLSDPNDAVKIRATGFGVDMAQHTIPYVTLQDVTYPDKKGPLGGLELYYARAKGYGGFLGFRLQGYDFTDTFLDKMSQEDIDNYTPDYDRKLINQIPVKD